MASDTSPERFRDHWWWRPGWRVGTRYLTWHILFEGAHDVHRLAAEVQERLRPYDILGPVATEGLHMTMVGVGHRADISDAQLDAVLDAVRFQLADFPPIDVTFGEVRLMAEGVSLVPGRQRELVELRRRLRTGVRAGLAVPPGGAADDDDFLAHVTVAYATGEGDTRAVHAALAAAAIRPAEHRITDASLLLLHRDDARYAWDVSTTVPLGG